MSSFTLTDVSVYADGFDFSSKSNQISLSLEVGDNDVTTFQGGGYRSRIGGLRDTTLDVSGFWDAGSGGVDPKAFPLLGSADRAVMLSPDSSAGSTAYVFRGTQFSYEMFGAVGDATPFSLNVMGSDGIGLVRGKTAAAKQNVSATGALGSGLTDLSTDDMVSASQFLYATLQVFSAGTTMTVVLESDDNAGFASATTQATLGPITSAGAVWTRVAGPITDTFYRFRVSAITGTFSVAGAIAIQ